MHSIVWDTIFTPEEIESGELGGLMIDEDFDFETTVSLLSTNLSSLSCTP